MSPRRITGLIGLAQLLAWGSSYYLLAILATPMAATFALPNVAIYGMFSVALVVAAIFGPVVGRWVDQRGGRRVLMISNGMFASAQLLMATAQHPAQLAAGWLLMGVAMPMGLYDVAFAMLVRLYRAEARTRIVGVTLIAGFASSVSWPLTALVEHHYSWRIACAMWAVLHLTVGLFIHARLLPQDNGTPMPLLPLPEIPADTQQAAATSATATGPSRSTLWLLATVFAVSGFSFAALAAHLPRLLQATGATPAVAVMAASLVGISGVVARGFEMGVFSRWHPLYSARISLIVHPTGALLLGLFGAPMAVVFTVLHGSGVGLMTIVKGTLPLALFGAKGFGQRAGWLEAPSRVMQAIAPVAYGLWLEQLGTQVLWITGLPMFASFLAMLWLRRSRATVTASTPQ